LALAGRSAQALLVLLSIVFVVVTTLAPEKTLRNVSGHLTLDNAVVSGYETK